MLDENRNEEIKPLPEGEYKAVITRSEMIISPEHKPFLNTCYSIVEGPFKGRKIFHCSESIVFDIKVGLKESNCWMFNYIDLKSTKESK
jgi:hypothetical protein